MMLRAFIALFLIFHTSWAQNLQNSSNTQLSTNTSIYNDTIFQLKQIQNDNDILHKKFDELNFSIQQHLIQQQNELDKYFTNFYTTLMHNMLGQNAKSQPRSIAQNALPASCAEALKSSNQQKGIFRIKIPNSKLKPFFVNCFTNEENNAATIDANTTAPWMLILRRMNGKVDFKRNWTDFQQGFGNLEGEFFLGLDKINALTQSKLHELWVQLEDFEGEKRWAKYSSFAIGNENEKYSLNILGAYTGNAGDSLSKHADQKFSTKDMDNDGNEQNCAQYYGGAWWHHSCYNSNLNGIYYSSKSTVSNGVSWNDFHTQYSLKYAHMAIRPVQ